MQRKYISAVKPLENFILQVDFVSGSKLFLNLGNYLEYIRFRSLKKPEVWQSAVTNGIFVRFGNVELSHDEILEIAGNERAAV